MGACDFFPAVLDSLPRRVPAENMTSDTQEYLDQTPMPTPAPVDPTEAVGPFRGIAAEIPGTIEAELYDYGGPGVAYSDTDTSNNGGVRDRLGRRRM